MWCEWFVPGQDYSEKGEKKKYETRKSSKIICQILGICTYTDIENCILRSNRISSDPQRLIIFEMKKYQNTISSGV